MFSKLDNTQANDLLLTNSTNNQRKSRLDLSISQRLSLLFSSLVLINLVSVGIGGLAINRMRKSAPELNTIGSVRMLTFKLSYLTNIRDQKTNGLDKVAIEVSINEEVQHFDKLLDALRNGSNELGLSPITNSTVRLQLQKVETSWRIYKSNIENYLKSAPNQGDEYLLDINNMIGFLTNELDVVTKNLESEAADTANQSQILLGIAVAISLLSIPVAFFLVSSIVRSLSQVTQTAQSMAKGNFDTRAKVTSSDEVGVLASTLNIMAEQIDKLLKSLTARGQELEENLAYISAVVDNLADGLLVTDTQCRITKFNPAFLAMFGLKDIDLLGKDCHTLSIAKITELLDQTKGTFRETFTGEVELAGNKVGQAVATTITKNQSENKLNESLGTVVLIRDITAEKEIDRMKTDFISTVSHELRTPLTSVMGFAKLIKKKLEESVFPILKTDDKKVARAIKQVEDNINIIVSEGERLTSLINDVLDIAKMEAGKIEWHMQPISIEEVIDRALAATSALFEVKGLQLIKDLPLQLPQVIGDRDRLIQVVINLISNANKFTDSGSVTCKARQQDNQVIVSIIDTGIGINSIDQPLVFEKFKQVGDTLTDKPKGTGLGLPICKQIVEHHGGRIWVESKMGVGSIFSFTLPLSINTSLELEKINVDTLVKQLKQSIVQTTANQNEQRKTIMVVDDDTHIREFLKQVLEAEGYEVKEAKDGMDAITQIKITKPDLILLDVMMPQINGFDVAAVLKNDPRTMGIPIIILSIFEDKERGFRLGIDRYFTKPVNTDGLLKDINVLISQEISNKKVLVVDKDTSTVRLLSDILQAQGYNVVEASDGQECIEKAISVKPDMIIVNSLFSQEHNLVKTLRFEKGLENVFFVLLADSEQQDSQ